MLILKSRVVGSWTEYRAEEDQIRGAVRKLTIDYVNFIKECWAHTSVRMPNVFNASEAAQQIKYENNDDFPGTSSNQLNTRRAHFSTAAIITGLSTRVSRSS
jgi:hypothetical protein